jgi:hypothetical protein
MEELLGTQYLSSNLCQWGTRKVTTERKVGYADYYPLVQLHLRKEPIMGTMQVTFTIPFKNDNERDVEQQVLDAVNSSSLRALATSFDLKKTEGIHPYSPRFFWTSVED